MKIEERLPLVLLLLRVGVFVVMLMWTLDKLVHAEHAAKVFQTFFFISGFGAAFYYVVGAIELVVIIGFLSGFKKRWTYGIVLVVHAISTVSTFRIYLAPFSNPLNLLYFAAWPMLAACFALYYLRDADTLLTVDKR